MASPTVTVGAVRERPGFGPGDTLMQWVDIPFTVQETGSSGMVSMPASQFTAERAQREIAAKVDEIWRLHQAFGGQ